MKIFGQCVACFAVYLFCIFQPLISGAMIALMGAIYLIDLARRRQRGNR